MSMASIDRDLRRKQADGCHNLVDVSSVGSSASSIGVSFEICSSDLVVDAQICFLSPESTVYCYRTICRNEGKAEHTTMPIYKCMVLSKNIVCIASLVKHAAPWNDMSSFTHQELVCKHLKPQMHHDHPCQDLVENMVFCDIV